MARALRAVGTFLLFGGLMGCGGKSSPAAPSTSNSQPTATTYTIGGTVTVGASSTVITNTTIRVSDGPNAGKSATTDGSGHYTLSGLTFAGGSVDCTASGYVMASRGLALTQGVTNSTVN